MTEVVAEALARVSLLDFELLKRKLASVQGWSDAHTAETETLYRQFLALNVVFPDRKICPNAAIDTFWHAHIMDTRAYEADCAALFGPGRLLHHCPYFGMRGQADAAALETAFRASCRLFVECFDVDITDGTTAPRSCSSQRCP